MKKVRVLQLKNNFYRDEDYDENYSREKALGAWCVLGYFDALDIKEISLEQEKRTWENLSDLTVQELDGTKHLRNLVCLVREHEKDTQFWNINEQKLFYFISMIRVDRKCVKADKLNNKINQVNQFDYTGLEWEQIAYYTYDHSEVIIAHKTDCYSEGLENIRKIRDKFSAFKMHTILALPEEKIKDEDSIIASLGEQNEVVDWRLHVVAKDVDNVMEFVEDIKAILEQKGENNYDIRCYDTLGSYDLLIEIDNIKISSICACYCMGELLTHSNQKYQALIYNIESEILIKK